MVEESDRVEAFLAELDHPLRAEIERVRAIVLAADTGIRERIKWNAPSFGYGDEDRVTLRLRPGNRLQIIFHRGAKVMGNRARPFGFADRSGLLHWLANDRGMVAFSSMDEVRANEAALARLVRDWLRATAPDTERQVT